MPSPRGSARSATTLPTLLVCLVACNETTPTDVAKPAVTAGTSASAAPQPGVTVPKSALASFGTLPKEITTKANPLTNDKISLGRMLYYDARVSKNHDVSCNSCHSLSAYGMDGLDVSVGHKQQKGGRNAPTVYNAAGHLAQFWDGRAEDVEAQAKGPPLNPIEMAMADDKAVVAVLASMPGYVEAFKKAFPKDAEPISFDNFGRAIGAFERRLMTPGPWDDFQNGKNAALTDAQKAGFLKFVEIGCPACHSGPYLGGAMYQRLGLVKPWPNQSDKGRSEVTKNASEEMFFKVPSLRNIEKTAPYFHDASAKTLPEAVTKMAEHQLGRTLPAADVASIVAFLGSLTGTIPADYVKEPELPPSTDATPKPDPS